MKDKNQGAIEKLAHRFMDSLLMVSEGRQTIVSFGLRLPDDDSPRVEVIIAADPLASKLLAAIETMATTTTNRACRYHGKHSAITAKLLMPSAGNQCAMRTDAFVPCAMELAGLNPDWSLCPLRTRTDPEFVAIRTLVESFENATFSSKKLF